MSYEETIKKHYAEESKRNKDSPQSTMQDQTIREREVQAILSSIATILATSQVSPLKVLEIGCGNGYLMSLLCREFPAVEFDAIEFTEELLRIAKSRNLKGVRCSQGDCRDLAFENGHFDVVIGERVLINLLEEQDQERALREIARVLKQGGYYLMVESFREPYENLNAAREELGMSPLPMPHHNLYFSESILGRMSELGLGLCDLGVEPNFLSSHYFIGRVLHEAVRAKEGKIHNTGFVEFFDQALPRNIGNYGAVKFYSFRKGGE